MSSMKVNSVSENGIIIGRFQVSKLHEAHIKLINFVLSRHKKVAIFLGCSPITGTIRNPLDFLTRKQMIQNEFPGVAVLPIQDNRSDSNWCDDLNQRIKEIFPEEISILYGGRDSFIEYYKGVHNTYELEEEIGISGTENRMVVSREVRDTEDFRAGVIYSRQNRRKTSYQTVETACYDSKTNKVLMGRKKDEKCFSFIGGFVDTQDESFEYSAKRKFGEKTGHAEAVNFQYIGSYRIDDWRYEFEPDKILTAFFVSEFVFGPIKADSGITELVWLDLDKVTNGLESNYTITKEHRPLVKIFLKWKDVRNV